MILRDQFGRTGHASARMIFGAYALSKATQAEADRMLYLLECGVNHVDTAPIYGNAEKASPRRPRGRQTSIKKLAIDEWRRPQR
jgi:aryl-alcohol dehydrogenase-like predicted oxidoreductase